MYLADTIYKASDSRAQHKAPPHAPEAVSFPAVSRASGGDSRADARPRRRAWQTEKTGHNGGGSGRWGVSTVRAGHGEQAVESPWAPDGPRRPAYHDTGVSATCAGRMMTRQHMHLTLGDRNENLDALQAEQLDVLVVGGGITGAGIALDAATRNLRVGLITKGDFAGGTSSRSSKLVHGGLRYLPRLQFRLVREAAQERNLLLSALAPGLVRPLEFVVPRTGLSLSLGLWLYTRLGGAPPGHSHRRLSRKDVLERVHALRGAEITGGHSFWDARTDDVRLTLAVLKHAHRLSAVPVNYARLAGFLQERDRTVGALVEDETTGERFEIRARATVLATGVWLDEILAELNPDHRPRVTSARGTHLVVPADRVPAQAAFMLRATDGRPVFVLPWHGRTVIGTTDVLHEGSLDDPQATAEEVRYLLDAVNANCPELHLGRDDVLAVQAGLRALIDAKSPDTFRASREDRIFSPGPGLIAVVGGKLTTYRRMAERVVDAIARELRHARGPSRRFERTRTGQVRLTGPYQELDDASIAPEIRVHLAECYGQDAAAVIDAPGGVSRLRAGSPFVWGEVDHAVRHEMVVHVGDVLARRTRVALTDRRHGRDLVDAVVARVGDAVGWDDARRRRERTGYERTAAAFDVPEF